MTTWTRAPIVGAWVFVAWGCRAAPAVRPATAPVVAAEPAARTSAPPPRPVAPRVAQVEPETEPPPQVDPDPTSDVGGFEALSDPFGGPGREADHRAEVFPPDLAFVDLEQATRDGPEIDIADVRAALPRRARPMLDEYGDTEPRVSVALTLDLAVWLERWGAVQSTLLIVDGTGRVRSATTFEDRVPMVGIVDLFGDATPELVVEVIGGTALSSWPRSWQIHRITDAGKLVRVASFAKAYDYGAKYPQSYFHNTVTRPSPGTLRVETTVFEERGPSPPPGAPKGLGEVFELNWDPAGRRLVRRRP